MTGLEPPQGSSSSRPGNGRAPVSLWQEGRRAFQRYLLISTGICSTALGLALIVSVLAAAYGEKAGARGVSAAHVQVGQVDGRGRSTSLDTTIAVVSPHLEPDSQSFSVASPAPPLDVERRATEPAPAPTAEAPAYIETPPPAPPATDLDPTATPQPLDEAAAALARPLLVQDEEPEALVQGEIAPPGGMPSVGPVHGVNVTFYDCLVQGFCGAMYNGEPVYEGAAACSWDLPLGTRFVIQGDPTGRVYVCADRGLLSETWVDIFFYSPEDGWAWQQAVGRYSTILIVSVPEVSLQTGGG